MVFVLRTLACDIPINPVCQRFLPEIFSISDGDCIHIPCALATMAMPSPRPIYRKLCANSLHSHFLFCHHKICPKFNTLRSYPQTLLPKRDRTKPTNRGFLSPPQAALKPSSSMRPGVFCPLFAQSSTFEPPSLPFHRVSILFNRFNRGFLSPIHRFLAVLMGRSLPPARRA